MSQQIPKECERFRELLPEQAEGRLAGRDRVRLERHLAECPRCSAEVEDLKAVIHSVRAVPAEEVPEDLIPRVRRAVHDAVPAPAPAVPSLPWARLAIPVAVLMAVVGITFALRAPKQKQFAAGVGAVDESRMRRAGKPAPSEPGRTNNIQIASKSGEGVSGPAGAVTPGADERRSSSVGVVPSVPNVSVDGRLGAQDESAAATERTPVERERPAFEPPPAPAAPHLAKRAPAGTGMRGSGGARGGGGGARHRGGAGGRGGTLEQAPMREEAVAADRAQRVEGPAPPIGAAVALADSRSGKMLALKLFSETPVQDISLSLGQAPPQSYEWQGPSARPAWIPLTPEQVGPGPTRIPVKIEAGDLKRDYVLFLPVMSRLGESAPSAPVIRYDARPVSSVLSELTALSGLIVLAESPLDATVSGQTPPGTPAEALTWVAGETGFDIHSESGLAYTLTHSR